MIRQDASPNDPARHGRTHLGPPTADGRSGDSGRGPDIRERIARAVDASEEELVEWLCNDQIRGWHAGHRIPAEAYLALHPALRGRGNAAFEVVYSEFMLRESMGESPCIEEYAWRFPELADRLRRQLALHRALARDEPGGEAPARTLGGGDAEDGPGLEGAPEIPGYRILGELGRGGAGVVYRARQLALNRLVALKVIQAGHHALPGAAGRFRAEAEAAARFQHPNIIQVYEVGEHEGLGYITLEYAAGGSLGAAIAGTPQDPAASAALVEQLARAIHYAHGCGIVHRDLKPANIVLAEGRVPKITDFGLAKLLEQEAAPTVSGTILGTPSYMAPEQLLGPSGDITPAADVYALGAILYEALTGRPPFKGATPLSTLDQVANQEPLVPSSLQRSTPRDLETICMKCLEKAPSRRYASADAMADDLRRFLDGRPILARPSPPWEKAAKWARRRPGLAVALLGLALAVAVVFAGILRYNALLRAGVRAAREAKDEADRKTRFALEQRNLAMQALDKLVFEVQERLGETPATRHLRQSLLDTAIAGLDDLATSTEATPPDMSRAAAHQKLGEIYRQVGRSAEAGRQFELAVRLAEQRAEDAPGDLAARDCLIRAHIGLGELGVFDPGNTPALEHFQRVVDLSEQVAASGASRPGDRRGLLEAYIRLGRAYGFRRDYGEAVAWFRRARDLAGRWTSEEPGSAEASAMLAWSDRKLGDIHKLSGDLEAARGDYLRAIAVGRESLGAHPADRETKAHLATAMNDLAGVLHRRRDLAGAEPLYADAEALFADLVGSDPENADIRLSLIHDEDELARLLRETGRPSEAAPVLRRAIENLGRIPSQRIAAYPRADYLRPGVLQRYLSDCEAASTSAAAPGATPPPMTPRP
ncbi:Serine/threonine-protein kinase PknB [Aquisphaera giovannonii]|uniref:Serine/threonine-protein kinase PknB n=1 Tax=Aquisphaera giovannonii TaxID=406548 RepID=A0A5B9W6A6_9BACT|nr:serine/threonine-protein kinase [Aquisphaera giovannonii]QEH35754.1 Serine/threonine-protein kinase PknB [Aquisphaera giovannonii]